MAARSVPYSAEHSVDLMDTCSVYLMARSMELNLVDVTDHSWADSTDIHSAATTDYSPECYLVDHLDFRWADLSVYQSVG